jgi:hypothetical protein
MKKSCVLPVLVAVLAMSATAQKSPYAGRWDLTVTPQSGNPFPQWMEITEKEGKLDGRFQPRGGAWRPLVAAKVDNGHLILTLAEATNRGPATTWDFTAPATNSRASRNAATLRVPRLPAYGLPN